MTDCFLDVSASIFVNLEHLICRLHYKNQLFLTIMTSLAYTEKYGAIMQLNGGRDRARGVAR